MSKTQPVTLVGGPADGLSYQLARDTNVIKWVPSTEPEQVLCRMNRHADVQLDPVLYVRSRRTPTLFVYQP